MLPECDSQEWGVAAVERGCSSEVVVGVEEKFTFSLNLWGLHGLCGYLMDDDNVFSGLSSGNGVVMLGGIHVL